MTATGCNFVKLLDQLINMYESLFNSLGENEVYGTSSTGVKNRGRRARAGSGFQLYVFGGTRRSHSEVQRRALAGNTFWA